MNDKNMSDILNDIDELEKQVITIALPDKEKYEYFSNAILELKQQLFEMDDQNSKNGVLDFKELIEKIQHLRFEFHQYLKTGNKDISQIELVWKQENQNISGIENKKRYRINLYRSILNDLKRSTHINLEKLKILRTKWIEEINGDLGYSPIEIDVIEEEFASVFLSYQIGSIQKKEKMLDENFAEFCEQAKYEKKLKEKLLEKIQQLEEGTTQRLDLEQLFTSGDLEEILESTEFWSVVSGIDVGKENIKPYFPPAVKMEEKQMLSPIPQQNTELIAFQFRTKNKLLCKIRISIFGRRFEFLKKFRFNKEGGIEISDMWRNRIIEISIPEGITEIKPYTFRNFNGLEHVYFPESLIRIGEQAFSQCKNLREVVIPQNVETIEKGAFEFCRNLTKADLGKSEISKLYKGTFLCCENLQKVDLPKKIEQIEFKAFAQTGIKEIEFPEGLISIGEAAFVKSKLIKLDLPESVESIGDGAFEFCKNLKKVNLSANIEKVPYYAFHGCSSLEDIKLPQNLRKIEERAFSGCAIKRIRFPKKLREIEEKAFAECLKLDEVEIEERKDKIKIHKNAIPFGVKVRKISEQTEEDDDNTLKMKDIRKQIRMRKKSKEDILH